MKLLTYECQSLLLIANICLRNVNEKGNMIEHGIYESSVQFGNLRKARLKNDPDASIDSRR